MILNVTHLDQDKMVANALLFSDAFSRMKKMYINCVSDFIEICSQGSD